MSEPILYLGLKQDTATGVRNRYLYVKIIFSRTKNS